MRSERGLLLRIKRLRHYKTTDSNHPFKRYPNLIRDKVFSAPNQAWAGDITYVETSDGVCYLSLITDLYSRKIVGWALGTTLQTVYCQRALQMALETLQHPEDSEGLIHHSDRGCQYCSYGYVNSLKSRGIQISMTESGDPLENAVAERVNGIIKSEWLYGVEIKDYVDCYERVSQAIEAYNNLRPHIIKHQQRCMILGLFLYAIGKRIAKENRQTKSECYRGLPPCLIGSWPIKHVWADLKGGKTKRIKIKKALGK